MNVLSRIVDSTRSDVERRRREVPLSELEARLAHRGDDRPFSEALSGPGVSIIAEHKRRSPSAGSIRDGATVEEIVCAYERGGAAALSILTEGQHFGGTLDDLREARRATNLPILRKDFIVDRYQVYETAAAGADALLLIVAALDDDDLVALHGEAAQLDLDVLVEVHDEEELDRALEVDADVIGINNRDLDRLLGRPQPHVRPALRRARGQARRLGVGLYTREQLEELERVGIDAVLVGERLMRAPDPEEALRELAGGTEPTDEVL